MPPANSFTPLARRGDVPALVLPTIHIPEPRNASIESRLAAIEERLDRQDAERASWERLKVLGMVLAA